jgi:alkanesulfonate monooxygenase SsuD/methylene tetrahydromethanopterin reductase-like flavin-dependent oxidoreductase (luciferase family)
VADTLRRVTDLDDRPTVLGGLGIMLPNGTGSPATWSDAPARFADLEASGCTAIWLTDHLLWGEPMPEALVMSAIALTATTTCRVGPGVLQLPLRSAAAVAKAAATLDVVSSGRFLLGVGAGEHRIEFERSGARFERRGRQLDDAIDEVRSFWGPSDERFAQRPVPGPIPIWVGGRSPRALRRAARHGDGWMPIFVSVDQFRDGLAALDDLASSSGRRAGEIGRAVAAVVSVTSQRWTRRDALEWAGRLWSLDPSRLDRHVITGSADECAEQLGRYRAAGAQHVTVLLATDEPIDMFAALAPSWDPDDDLSS